MWIDSIYENLQLMDTPMLSNWFSNNCDPFCFTLNFPHFWGIWDTGSSQVPINVLCSHYQMPISADPIRYPSHSCVEVIRCFSTNYLTFIITTKFHKKISSVEEFSSKSRKFRALITCFERQSLIWTTNGISSSWVSKWDNFKAIRESVGIWRTVINAQA